MRHYLEVAGIKTNHHAICIMSYGPSPQRRSAHSLWGLVVPPAAASRTHLRCCPSLEELALPDTL